MKCFFTYSAVIILSLIGAGCAATYSQPQALNKVEAFTINASKSDIMKAAKRTLVLSGYQITSYDDVSGVISTAPRNKKVTPEQADCGTTMGIDYLKDNRTETNVSYGIIVEDSGHTTVRTTIQGNYRPGSVNQNITLTCISRGILEKLMMTKIRSQL
jgi:hypothetical protein